MIRVSQARLTASSIGIFTALRTATQMASVLCSGNLQKECGKCGALAVSRPKHWVIGRRGHQTPATVRAQLTAPSEVAA
jgi:hypothetical protein